MRVYLRAKFEVSNIILTSFIQGGGNFTPSPPPPYLKRTPKKPTQISVKPFKRKLGKDAFYRS